MNEIFQAVQNAPVSPIELNGIDSLVTTETCLYAQGDEVIYYCYCFVVVVVVVVVIIIIIISYCLTFVCLQFSSTEFIYALGGERKKPMYAICTTPSLRSFLNVAFKTVSFVRFTVPSFQGRLSSGNPPFSERTEKGSLFRFPFNRMLIVKK